MSHYKKLHPDEFTLASQFIKTDARALERALFVYHFEAAPAQNVLDELAHYQNGDGGYGRAFEPDLRTPSSSTLATSQALSQLKELACPADFPMVRSAVTFLLDTIDEQNNVWAFAPSDANDHPHAPWWHDDSGSLAMTFDGFRINPRALIVGLLHHYATLVPPDWLYEITEVTVAAVEAAGEEELGGGGDALRAALDLAETQELPEEFKTRLKAHLRAIAPKVVSLDPGEWGSYCAQPLKVVPTPDCMIADLIWEALQLNLDFQIEAQTPQGFWEPNWNWGGTYSQDWERAKREWRGRLTLNTLLTLRAYGRLEID